MSRTYKMHLEIRDFDPEKTDAIIEACTQEWPFDLETCDQGTLLIGSGMDNLCGGESEDEFATRLTHAIWEANGAYCDVTIRALYLDELPYETYDTCEDDYQEWAKTRQVA